MSLISVVVPVYNNASSLPELLARLQAVAERQRGLQFEFIFVDDGSQDDSARVARSLVEKEPRLSLVKLSRNFGSNAAILAGLSHAAGDAVVAIAADLQDPPELIEEMVLRWKAGRKIVLAARESRDDPWPTSLLANAFYALFRRFALRSMPKHGFDFFLVDRQVCDWLTRMAEANSYLMGLILWLGFDPDIVYYHRCAREKRFGRSMWTFAKKVKYFADAFVAFSHAPLRAASAMGFFLCLIGAVYAACIVFLRLTSGIDLQGWTSLMVVLLVVSGAQMMMTGALGEYLCRTLEQSRRRPPFICDEVVRQESAAARRTG